MSRIPLAALYPMFLLSLTPRASAQQVPRPGPPPPDPLTEMRAAAARTLAELGPLKSIDEKVGRLIDRLVLDDGAKVQAAVDALVELGQPAVPAIIRRMDDRRAMKVRTVSFVNKAPDAFEGLRHYGVEQVVDVLDDVLNDITGRSLGHIDTPVSIRPPIENSPDEVARKRRADPQRDAVVAGWKRYLVGLSLMPRVPSKSMPGKS